MRERLIVAAWAATVLVVSSLHDLRFLIAGPFLVAVVAGRRAPAAARRALLAVAVFGGTVGATWLAVALVQGDPPWPAALRAVARLELRAFLLTFLTFGVLGHVDGDRFLAAWPSLRAGRVVVLSQIRMFRRLLDDFGLALESRSIRPLGWSSRLGHAAAATTSLLTRAMREADEIGMAMEARGLLGSDPTSGEPVPPRREGP